MSDAPLAAAWLNPTSVDPRLFINREAEARELRACLEERLQGEPNARILVCGDRGVGKSIFSRKLLKDFTAAHPTQVVEVILDGRGMTQRRLLSTFAQNLARGARDVLVARGEFEEQWERWATTLVQLATNARIVRGFHELRGREHGASAGGEGGLLGTLTGSFLFAWKERREQGQKVEETLEVSDDVLRSAINLTLRRIADRGLRVAVLFDDLDQAGDVENPQAAKAMLQELLAIEPCVGVVHLRNEVLSPDIRREMGECIALEGLSPDTMERLFDKRLEDAPAEVRRQLGQGRGPLQRLFRATDNPHVALRWVHGLLRAFPWPPPADWTSLDRRIAIVKRSTVTGIDDPTLRKLGVVLDRCSPGGGPTRVSREALLAGQGPLDTGPRGEHLSEELVENLLRTEVLLPVDRYDPGAGLTVDRIVELARPSFASRLGG